MKVAIKKLKLEIPVEHLAARYNWCQGPVPGRGPAVEKHWLKDKLQTYNKTFTFFFFYLMSLHPVTAWNSLLILFH